jgi:hypothetical protein
MNFCKCGMMITLLITNGKTERGNKSVQADQRDSQLPYILQTQRFDSFLFESSIGGYDIVVVIDDILLSRWY